MRGKKYRLRNGVVVTPVNNYGAVHVVDTQNAVFVAVEEYTVRDVTEAWAVGNVRQLLAWYPNLLSWEGGAWGEQFDVIAEVVELVVEYKLLPQCKGESDSIWREVTE